MAPSSIISFFKDCYYHDKNRRVLTDVYHNAITHRHFLSDQDDFILGFNAIHTTPEYITGLEKKANLYREEKEILYGTGFISGHINDDNGEDELLATPLLLCRCQIQKHDGYKVIVRSGEWDFNEGIIEKLYPEYLENSEWTQLQDQLRSSEDNASKPLLALCRLLKRHYQEIHDMDMISYPKLYDQNVLKKKYRSEKSNPDSQLSILPCSMVGLFNKIETPRGILSELHTLSQHESTSSPLQALFEGSTTRPQQETGKTHFAPAILSEAQQKILSSARQNDLTLVVGPPGTGKSFTISALAIDQLARGKSVLIVSKTESALDVIAEKLQSSLQADGCWVRGGSGQHLKSLKSFLSNLLSGLYIKEGYQKKSLKQQRRNMHLQQKQLNKLKSRIIKQTQHVSSASKVLANPDNNLFLSIKKWVIKKVLKQKCPLWKLHQQLDNLSEDQLNSIHSFIQAQNNFRLGTLLDEDRTTLQQYQKGIRARTGGRMEEMFNEMDERFLLEMFPIWLANLNDLYRVLPLTKELFDLVIIDEASQCDIASSIPALFRAKKAVIAGDPHQLRHLSFLSKAKQAQLFEEHSLPSQYRWDYRNTSILDLTTQKIKHSCQQAFLNEHYRSVPSIISFSNQRFYDGKITLMTDHPNTPVGEHLKIIRSSGTRNAQGVNSKEISDIMDHISKILKAAKTSPPSIGILSPFRNQVDALSSSLLKNFPLETINQSNIITGTPHSFQGHERDIMLISLCIDDNTHNAALRYMEQPNVFNVAITRARSQQFIFKSFNESLLKNDSLLNAYLNHKTTSQEETTSLNLDIFSDDVSHSLTDLGYTVEFHKPIAGLSVDLWITKENHAPLIVDLIGYAGAMEEAISFNRHQILQRIGFDAFPISFAEWTIAKPDILKEIVQTTK